MMGFDPKELKRMMKRMGINVEDVNAVRVVIELDDGSLMIVESPQVALIKMRGQPPVLNITGEIRREESKQEEQAAFSEDDVKLVAEQAGVSLEEARRALEEAGGDIAEAILRLQESRG